MTKAEQKIYRRRYYLANREQSALNSAEYYQLVKDSAPYKARASEASRRYRLKHRKERNLQTQAWKSANTNRVRDYRKTYHYRNHESQLAHSRAYRLENKAQCKENNCRYIAGLQEPYVIGAIIQGSVIARGFIPKEIIRLKTVSILFARILNSFPITPERRTKLEELIEKVEKRMKNTNEMIQDAIKLARAIAGGTATPDKGIATAKLLNAIIAERRNRLQAAQLVNNMPVLNGIAVGDVDSGPAIAVAQAA
jgi:hypothetical protein